MLNFNVKIKEIEVTSTISLDIFRKPNLDSATLQSRESLIKSISGVVLQLYVGSACLKSRETFGDNLWYTRNSLLICRLCHDAPPYD